MTPYVGWVSQKNRKSIGRKLTVAYTSPSLQNISPQRVKFTEALGFDTKTQRKSARELKHAYLLLHQRSEWSRTVIKISGRKRELIGHLRPEWFGLSFN